jgi:hypothetical protein
MGKLVSLDSVYIDQNIQNISQKPPMRKALHSSKPAVSSANLVLAEDDLFSSRTLLYRP